MTRTVTATETAELGLCQHPQKRQVEPGVSGVDKRTEKLISTWDGDGVAAGDHIHSQRYGRGSSLFQLNLLRENLTTAELRRAHVVGGLCSSCTCTVKPFRLP